MAAAAAAAAGHDDGGFVFPWLPSPLAFAGEPTSFADGTRVNRFIGRGVRALPQFFFLVPGCSGTASWCTRQDLGV